MSIFNSIHLPRPADGLASRVARPGVHWEPAKNLNHSGGAHSDLPLPMAKNQRAHTNDLTGVVAGRLTVLGLAPKKEGKKRRWVVRCACGTYEQRTAKFLKSDIAGVRGMCLNCDYLEGLKAGLVPAAGLAE